MRMFRRYKERANDSTVPFIQPKLNIGKPGDRYEVEADAMANKVVNNSGSNDTVQKSDSAEEDIHQKPLATSITPLVQKQSETSEEDNVQAKCAEYDNEEQVQRMEDEETVQAKPETSKASSRSIETNLRSSKGSGSGLPNSVKNEMELGFGADFSQVNIHTNSNAIQMSKQINAQAFTHGNDIYFNRGKFSPSSKNGKHLLAHELTHTVQQRADNTQLQRKLTVEDEYPQDLITDVGKRSGAGKLKGEDPSKALSNQDRLNLVRSQLSKLTTNFEVKGSGEVLPISKKITSEKELAKDEKATASCCLRVLTRKSSKNDWHILVTDHLFPHTDEDVHKVIINTNLSPFELGFHNTAGEKISYENNPERILGHELCGHAALMELDAHTDGKRAVTNVHDSTINIENEIAKESLGLTDEMFQRGHAGDGPHKGESFGHSEVIDFEFNKSEIDKKGKEKLTLISDMVKIFDLFIELRGHSDNVGSENAKQDISDARATRVFNFIKTLGVSDKASVDVGTPEKRKEIKVKRFLRKGMSDKEPRKGIDPITEQHKLRRVDVFVASFPAGLSEIPVEVPNSQRVELARFNEVKEPSKVKDLRNGSPCEQLLVEKAFPKP